MVGDLRNKAAGNTGNNVRLENNILYGPPLDFQADNRGLGAYLFDACQKNADKICQVCVETDEEETFNQVRLRSIRMALEMRRRGLKPGDIITLCSLNTMHTKVTVLASLFLGVTSSCIDPSLSATDAIHLLSLVNPKIVFTCSEGKKLMDIVSASNADVASVVLLGGEKDTEYWMDFQKESEEEKSFRPTEVQDAKKDNAFILFSSGTTGLSKGIGVTHYGLQCGVASMIKAGPNLSSLLHFSSLYWISAVMLFVGGFMAGGRTVVTNAVDETKVLKIFQDYKVTFAFLSSTYSYKMTAVPNASKYDLSNLHCIVFAGAALPAEQLKRSKALLGDTYTIVGYGQTEAAAFLTLFQLGIDDDFIESKPRSAGTPCYGIKLMILDEEGNRVGPNTQGEILFSAESTMSGYYNSTPASELFYITDDNQFIRTGDIGYYDDDNCVYIVDRIKDMFKYQCWHIVPAALEAILMQHPAVRETVVFGTKHSEDGDWPTAAVVLHEGYVDDGEGKMSQDIADFVTSKVIDRERLRGGVKIIEKIPRTPSGKVLRRKIREMFC